MSRHLDEQDPDPGYEGLIAHTSMAPDGYFLDWAPGHTPYVAPDGMAFPIEEKSDLVLMLHMRPSGKQEVVQASVGLYFTDTPPTRVPALLRLTRQDIDIPAGESHHVVSDVVPAAGRRRRIHGPAARAQPGEGDSRASRLFQMGPSSGCCRSRTGTSTGRTSTATSRLSHCRRASSVTMRWTYDNSSANPVNPNVPPKEVRFGQRTSDEMAELWFQVLPRNQSRPKHPDARTAVRAAVREHQGLRDDAACRCPAMRRCTTTSRCCTRAPAISSRWRRTSRRRLGSRQIPRPRTTTWARRLLLAGQTRRCAARVSAGRRARSRLRERLSQSRYRGAVGRENRGRRALLPAGHRAGSGRCGCPPQSRHAAAGAAASWTKRSTTTERRLRIDGDYVDALVDLAWALATSPDSARPAARRGGATGRTRGAVDAPPDLGGAGRPRRRARPRRDVSTRRSRPRRGRSRWRRRPRTIAKSVQIRDRLDLYRRRTPFRLAP